MNYFPARCLSLAVDEFRHVRRRGEHNERVGRILSYGIVLRRKESLDDCPSDDSTNRFPAGVQGIDGEFRDMRFTACRGVRGNGVINHESVIDSRLREIVFGLAAGRGSTIQCLRHCTIGDVLGCRKHGLNFLLWASGYTMYSLRDSQPFRV